MCKQEVITKLHKINIPDAATKQLKLQDCSAGRKLVVSTNFLPLFGFEYGTKIIEEVIAPNKGMRIRLANEDDKKTKKVYVREYKSRKNNPLEVLLDIRGQTIINKSFPSSTKTVHILFKQGVIEITPIVDKAIETIKRFKNTDNCLKTTLSCSSGIDGHSLENHGFEVDTLIEWRPRESRNKKDLSETGAFNALANLKINTLVNEDITNLDLDRIAELSNISTNSIYSISLQCNDFTNVKSKSLKEKSLEDGNSSLDMVFDAINFVSKFMPAVIMLEQVRGFKTSDAGKMFKSRLQKLGYKVTDEVMDSFDYGSINSRVRYYLIASLLPYEFKMPEKEKRNETPIWNEYVEPYILSGEARDVSHSKSLQDGLTTGRIRLITRDSIKIGTVLKIQDRMCKDSLVIQDELREDKLFFPSEKMIKQIMRIPDSVNLENTSKTIGIEILGQSIEYGMHSSILKKVKEHLLLAHARLNNRLF